MLRRFLAKLGPGLITGASDDDPSGIATYAVAGASLGYATLWTAVWTLPLMVAVQLTCARIGMVTGGGLTRALRRRYPAWLLYAICVLLASANVFNIGADLGGMADAMLLTGQRVVPDAATRLGYTFRYPDLESALREVVRLKAAGSGSA